MAKHSAERAAFPKRTRVATGKIFTSPQKTPTVNRSDKVEAVRRDALDNESYTRDKKAKG